MLPIPSTAKVVAALPPTVAAVVTMRATVASITPRLPPITITAVNHTHLQPLLRTELISKLLRIPTIRRSSPGLQSIVRHIITPQHPSRLPATIQTTRPSRMLMLSIPSSLDMRRRPSLASRIKARQCRISLIGVLKGSRLLRPMATPDTVGLTLTHLAPNLVAESRHGKDTSLL